MQIQEMYFLMNSGCWEGAAKGKCDEVCYWYEEEGELNQSNV